MLRTTLIHILILLAPTILYFAFLILSRRVQLSRSHMAAQLRKMPWVRLLGSGLVLAAASLVVWALTGRRRPRGHLRAGAHRRWRDCPRRGHRLSTVHAPWITAPATRAVIDALTAEGADVRFVGGCVRDALLGAREFDDIDIGTPDPPERVMALLE